MAAFRTLDDLEGAHGKRALVRVDLNVPMDGTVVTDATRLRATRQTVDDLVRAGARIILLAHFDRPKGKRVPEMSLRPVCAALAEAIGRDVSFIDDCVGDAAEAASRALAPGSVAVAENTRFHPGEETNDPAFGAQMAKLGDLYVNDAFSAAHRAHASTEGLAHLLPAFAGRTMQAELVALEKALGNPQRPVAAVVGGAKVSSKLDVLTNLVKRVDHLIIGGGMANTFLAARGIAVGTSLQEPGLHATALEIFAAAEAAGCTIHLPYDVVVATAFAAHAPNRVASIHDIKADEMVLDLGPAAVEALSDAVKTCRTLIWNGPLGAFETPPFEAGTMALARTVAALTLDGSLLSVAGGGDTVAALNMAGVANQFSFVSTAGGAFLEWMEGKPLPGVDALKR